MKTLTERILSRWTGTGVRVIYVDELNKLYILNSLEQSIAVSSGLENIKLLLRPNSDLTKPITHNGDTFVPIRKLFDTLYPETIGKGKDYRTTIIHNRIRFWLAFYGRELVIDLEKMEDLPYWILNQLHEWHFACGLDEGLWIDLNTITKGTE